MATLGGMAAGAALGALAGPGGVVFGLTAAQIGMAAGSVVGGIIDQQFVYPLIFGGAKPLDGLRIDDMMMQTASEGSPLNYCLGPTNRVPGLLLWMDTISSQKKRTAGKTGPFDYTYFVNVAIAICEGPIASVDRIYADSKLIWQKSNGQPGNNGSITGTLNTTGTYAQGVKTLSVTMSNNPGDSAVLKKKDHIQLGSLPTVYEITSDVTIAQGASGSITITPGLDGPVAFGLAVHLVDWTDGFVSGLTIYTGTTTQNPDPLMEGILGVGNVPAYRNIAYVVLDRFILAPFGNRLPNFTFQLAAQTTKTVASAISDILLRSGLSGSDFDVTRVTGNLDGYTISGPQPGGKALEPIMLGYNVDAQERDAKLVFFTRTNRDIVTVLETELAAHESGENEASPFIINDKSGFDLPNKVTVEFLDKKKNNEKGAARQRRIDSITQSEDTITLPIVLEHKVAKDVANRLLWDGWREQQSAEFALPASRIGVQEGDLVVVPFRSIVYNVRAMDVKVGANYVIQIQGNIEGYVTDDRFSTSEDLPTTDFSVYTPPPITMHYMDLPSLSDAEVRSWGVYIAICNQDPAAEWRGADVYYDKNDSGIALGRKIAIAKEATMGKAVSVLAGVVPLDSWDSSSTIDISMWSGTLTGSTDLDVLNGANRMLVQNASTGKVEVIGFVNAALVGTDAGHGGPIYRLSRLLRGLRNTTDAMAGHALDDVCTFVNDAVYFVPLTAADFNKPIFWRAVPAGGIVSNYASTSNIFLGRTLKPWSVYDIRISPPLVYRQLTQPVGFSVNITWTWKRRSRAIDRLFTEASDPDLLNPPVELPEKYIFELFNPAGTVILRKFTVDSATTLTLSDAELDAIFTPDTQWGLNAMICRISQISPLVGRGDPITFVG